WLSGAAQQPLLDVALEGSADKQDLTVAPTVGLEEISRELTPFMDAAGIQLAGIRPQAHVERFHTTLEFDSSLLKRLTAQLDVRPGPLASIDFQSQNSPLRELRLSLSGSATTPTRVFQATLNNSQPGVDGHVELKTDLAGLVVQSSGAGEGKIEATLDLHTDVYGMLSDRRPATNPIIAKTSEVFNNASRQFDKALQAFGS